MAAEVRKREIVIVNKLGLHARAAAKLVKLAGSFESDIELARDERSADAKSIMSVMMLMMCSCLWSIVIILLPLATLCPASRLVPVLGEGILASLPKPRGMKPEL